MFNNFFGMEAISFQTSSQLGKDLTAIFQEVIDFRDNLDYSNIPDNFYKRRLFRIKNVIQFCNKTMGPKFIKVLEKDLGFKVKNFNIYGSDDGSTTPCGFFAVNIDINAMGPDMYRSIMNMTGTNYSDTELSNKYADDVKELADCIDLDRGILKKTTIGKKIPITIQAIYFDAIFAFCLGEYIDEQYAEELTAEELAAFMMHECGHAMTVIEHAVDMYVTSSRIRNDAVNIKRSGDIKDAKALIKALDTKVVTKIVSIVNKSDFTNVSDTKNLKENVLKAATMVGKLNTLLDVAEKDKGSGSIIISAVMLPINVIMSLIHLLAIVIVDIALLAIQMITLIELMKYSYVDEHGDGGKAADRRNNKNSLFLLERWADEFVSRQGYGDHLASGLVKFHKAMNYIVNASPEFNLIHNDRSINKLSIYSAIVNMYLSICDSISLMDYLDPVIYENNYNRLKRILENSKGIFKEEKLPDNCVYEWIAKCKETEVQMQKAKRITDSEFGKAAINILHNLFILEPVNLWQLIKDGKLDRDCTILEDRLDDMRNNALFMMSHVFRTM
jgi:hypothetical protein